MKDVSTEKLAVFGGSSVMPEGIQRARWPRWSEKEIEEIGRVLTKEQIFGSDASQVTLLEKEWGERVQMPHCRAVSSGTAGLHMALWSAGVKPGDEVLVPAFSFMATALCVVQLGAIPVFVDVKRDSYNLDPAQIEKHITPRTKAMIVVHLFGMPADMDEINAVAKKHNIPVIEDNAHAQGATYKGKMAGGLGDISATSLNAVKNIVAGEAGLLATRHQEFADRFNGLSLFINLNGPREDDKYHLATLGFNYRCSVIGATLARGQFARLDEISNIRRGNSERLTAQIKDIPGIIAPQVPADRTHVYHMYRVRFDMKTLGVTGDPSEFRAKVIAALACEGVLLRSWMNWTLPDLPVFSDPKGFEARYPWRRYWEADRVYNSADYPEATGMVKETAMVAEAPAAVSNEVVDCLGAGIRKVFAQIDKIQKVKLTPELSSGSLSMLDDIKKRALEANA